MARKMQPHKKSMWTLLSLLVIALMGMMSLSLCTRPQEGADKKDSLLAKTDAFGQSGGDTIDVAIEINPLCYSMGGDKVSGLDYEILEKISKEGNVAIKYHPFVQLTQALEALDNGKVDMVVASLAATNEFKDSYNTSIPVYVERQLLAQPAEKAITEHVDLAGDSVWVAASSPAVARLQNLSDEIGGKIRIVEDSVHSPEQLFMMTALGQIPRAVVGEGTARHMLPQYPEVNIDLAISFEQFQVWAMRDDPMLSDLVNGLLDQVKESTFYEDLLRKYLK